MSAADERVRLIDVRRLRPIGEEPVTTIEPGDSRPPRHASTAALLRFFRFRHLPPHLREISAPFADVATWLVGAVAEGPELTAALRKLLEAKDCAVRAALVDED